MASAGDPPSAPDPNQVIAAQAQHNRYNINNPFGSSNWSSGGPGGHDSVTTTMSPQMQAMMSQAFGAAGAPRQQMQDPFGGGMSQLASAILSKVGARYGLGNGNANNPTLMGQQNAPHGGGPGQLSTNASKGNTPPPQMGGGMPGGGFGQGMGTPQSGLPGQVGGMPQQGLVPMPPQGGSIGGPGQMPLGY
jgi:hypothetical protein